MNKTYKRILLLAYIAGIESFSESGSKWKDYELQYKIEFIRNFLAWLKENEDKKWGMIENSGIAYQLAFGSENEYQPMSDEMTKNTKDFFDMIDGSEDRNPQEPRYIQRIGRGRRFGSDIDGNPKIVVVGSIKDMPMMITNDRIPNAIQSPIFERKLDDDRPWNRKGHKFPKH